jgi:glucose/mannose transport system permease protein
MTNTQAARSGALPSAPPAVQERSAAGPRASPATRSASRTHVGNALPLAVIWIPLLINAAHVVGFTIWTTWLSFTASDLLPEYAWAGLRSYWAVTRTQNTQIAYTNLVIYGIGFVGLATVIGFVLAVLLDQRIRAENVLRTIFLYPLAVSFVVTGTVWSWLLNPGLGIQKFVRDFGWDNFHFDWIIDRDMAIYTIVIAAAWHGAGFAMALFLAGLRSIDPDLVKAAQIDGAGPVRFYLRVVLPSIGAILIAVLVVLLQFAIKTFDLVRALTGGGPGIATMLPALVVYDFMFQRGQLGRGSAAAVLLLLSLLGVLLPYWGYSRWQSRKERQGV